MDRKPVDNERTLGPVGGEAVVVLPGLVRPERRRVPRVVLRGDWGPPVSPSRARAAAAAVALIASAALVTWQDGLDWTPDRMLLVFLVPALVLGGATRYLRDFVPFAILIFAYAELRGLAHVISPHPYYTPQLRLERALFGVVPAQWLQQRLWDGSDDWYDTLSNELLRVHYVVPPLLAFLLWTRSRALFFRFAASMIVLSFAAALVFAAFPAAPPWAAAQAGLLPGVEKLPHPFTADVSSVGLNAHSSLGSIVPGNPYAAIPSLHAGYAFLVFLTVASLALRLGGRFRWLLVALCFTYPLLQSLAVVYTGNHYVVDIVIGDLFALGAFVATNRAADRLGLPRR
jgi:PAP2 superfamily